MVILRTSLMQCSRDLAELPDEGGDISLSPRYGVTGWFSGTVRPGTRIANIPAARLSTRLENIELSSSKYSSGRGGSGVAGGGLRGGPLETLGRRDQLELQCHSKVHTTTATAKLEDSRWKWLIAFRCHHFELGYRGVFRRR